MAHFAEIDENNIVTQVIVVDDQYENSFDTFAKEIGLKGRWVQTSYNTVGGSHLEGKAPLRKNFASVGFTYDEQRDAFILPKPFDSWILNEETCHWDPPIECPKDGKFYDWDEETLSWQEVVSE